MIITKTEFATVGDNSLPGILGISMLPTMHLGPFRRKIISETEIRAAARELGSRILGSPPDTVVYIKEGGRDFGFAIAEELRVPVMGIDVGYPLSRALNSSNGIIRTLAWPVKELVYKCASPRVRSDSLDARAIGRVLLVDDSASTGRSVEAAILALEAMGVQRSSIKVAVFRCGHGAESFVDFFETGERVLFVGRQRYN